ncbi:hypothetical protein NLM33_06560 [Bradyrhizobium sp. CCGUVB1N3]|uniref:hypothetical protein n=1 Tax=Bradyrhizobium sp. CCGUVB1N3 TaxID=2949629 RepID=UPI0020B226B5|nr:hypothetical protein [Bradyrhizobium sp. CCGUVB1N3]MCP3469988.1 hypothetical protein [Bradyrhizobium sp. CCGUVB1N3]
MSSRIMAAMQELFDLIRANPLLSAGGLFAVIVAIIAETLGRGHRGTGGDFPDFDWGGD